MFPCHQHCCSHIRHTKWHQTKWFGKKLESCSLLCDVRIGKKIVCNTHQSTCNSGFFLQRTKYRTCQTMCWNPSVFSQVLFSFRSIGLYFNVIDLILHFGFLFNFKLLFFFFTRSGFYRLVVCSNQFLPHFLTSFSHHLAMFCTLLSLSSPLQFSPLSCIYSCCTNILQFRSVFHVLRQNTGMWQTLKEILFNLLKMLLLGWVVPSVSAVFLSQISPIATQSP